MVLWRHWDKLVWFDPYNLNFTSRWRLSYPGSLAGSALVVNLVLGPLVQLGPQSLDLPGADCGLQRAVEAAVVQGVQLQLPAQDAEGLQGALAGGRLHKVLKEHAGLRHALVLRLAHLPPLSFSPLTRLPSFPAHVRAVGTGPLRSRHV